MEKMDYAIKIAGQAGQGIRSTSDMLSLTFAHGGLFPFTIEDYESRIEGGHIFSHIRVSDKPISAVAFAKKIHLLVAMDDKSVKIHKDEVIQDGLVVYDGEKYPDIDLECPCFSVPFSKFVKDNKIPRRMINTIALGAVIALTAFDFEVFTNVLRKMFANKGEQVIADNIKAGQLGFDYIQATYGEDFPYKIKTREHEQKCMLLTGNQAIALGAIAAGLKFYAGYPMSPTTSIFNVVAKHARALGIIAQQAEDEIAAINMVIGAAFAGVRSMTATSGGGFSLMAEGVGLAGATETPIVIVLGQRPGPATGMATRTEQGDLFFPLFASQGEFPRAVLAPKSPDSAFYLVAKAFNLAEKYQIPVILLTDQYLADSHSLVPALDLDKISIDRGEIITEEIVSEIKDYKRYQYTDSGVSPRAFPGVTDVTVITAGNEHMEEGHPLEDAENRTKMHAKRMRKLTLIREEISVPEMFGGSHAEILILSWGSSFGVVREALDELVRKGLSIGLLHFEELWPFPGKEIQELLEPVKTLISVENNATSQLAKLIEMETGISVPCHVLKYDGRPFTVEYIVNGVLQEVNS